MSPPVLSVVIPTRNRREILNATLRGLARQSHVPGRFEVIVADDGSTDGSVELLRGSVFEAFDLKVLSLERAGPARARNRAVDEAESDRVLLLGDDTVPLTETLATHLRVADGREVAVQGRIDWDPSWSVTDVMAFLAPAGPQFWFRDLVDGMTVPWAQLLGSNLSAPTGWFRDEPFDERFTDACMEDTELGWRWRRRGWQTIWSGRAVCHHRHEYDSIEPFLERQRRAGAWARLAVRTHPGMARKLVVEPLVMVPRCVVRIVVRGLVRRTRTRDLWDLRCRWAYARGLMTADR
jgi:glycosyltransferase involved in cell wall biosynthesis